MAELINLFTYDRQALKRFFADMGESSFRATQLLKWIHRHGVTDFDEMTDISKKLRARLKEQCEVRVPEVEYEQYSNDGTRKWLLRMDDNNCIETVYIPESTRATVCVSSQVGCTLNCSFCSTGKQGFNRNLDTGEIVAQLWVVYQRLREETGLEHPVTNVVYMGMGEPLFNCDNVLPAVNLMLDKDAYNLSKYRVTVSTSGVIPAMEKLRDTTDASLAVSLHAPNNELRDELVPLNKKYPLEKLMPMCREYFTKEPKRSVTFEYVMLDKVNDEPEHARQLIELLDGIPSKINLIPFNPFPYTQYQCSSDDRMERFQKYLVEAGFNTRLRKTRGDDIDAACGQLAGKVQDRTNRNAKWRAKRRVIPVVQENA